MPTPKRLRSYFFERIEVGCIPSIVVLLSDRWIAFFPSDRREIRHVTSFYDLPHIVKHSPLGMDWGHQGSGPADTALSVLADFFGTEDVSHLLYQRFKDTFIAGMPAKGGVITEGQINSWFARYKSRLEA
ncbi:MAG: hypothetical protein FVQ81_02175 [Candidatus Glassbacteria bacterium]|nr:hypothetical protein [Candidatus Glassbacteria bacterium]